MDNELEDLLMLTVEKPSPSWRFRMMFRHGVPKWALTFFCDRFDLRMRHMEVENNTEEFSHWAKSPGHAAFMDFWAKRTMAAFSWKNYFEWAKKYSIECINGSDIDNLCAVCKRCCGCDSETREWRTG
jgi:hypothetical protein